MMLASMVNSRLSAEPTRSANVVIDHVRVEYPSGAPNDAPLVAIADVSLTIEPGEFVSIIGPSGCGKSSLLYLINGINAPTSGRITVGGELVTKPSAQRALVFQDASLLPWNSVRANVAMGLQVEGRPKAEREAAADARCSSWSVSTASATSFRTSSPAACVNAWASPGLCASTRRCS